MIDDEIINRKIVEVLSQVQSAFWSEDEEEESEQDIIQRFIDEFEGKCHLDAHGKQKN